MKKWAQDACNQIDAGLFSGDTFNDEKSLQELEYYMLRWSRQLTSLKLTLDHSRFFDYKNQAWVVDGKYTRCGHSPALGCGCYGRLHEGKSYVPEQP